MIKLTREELQATPTNTLFQAAQACLIEIMERDKSAGFDEIARLWMSALLEDSPEEEKKELMECVYSIAPEITLKNDAVIRIVLALHVEESEEPSQEEENFHETPEELPNKAAERAKIPRETLTEEQIAAVKTGLFKVGRSIGWLTSFLNCPNPDQVYKALKGEKAYSSVCEALKEWACDPQIEAANEEIAQLQARINAIKHPQWRKITTTELYCDNILLADAMLEAGSYEEALKIRNAWKNNY